MKNILIKLFVIMGVLSIAVGCTDNFLEINKNPNSPTPEKVTPEYLLTFVLNRSVLVSNTYQNVQTMNPDEFAQFFANSLQNVGLAASNYRINDTYNTNFWDNYMIWIAQLNVIINTHSDNHVYTNVVQMARIWRCWMFQRLTDAYGDIPYFKAGNREGVLPAYDSQKDIYYDMFAELKDASAKLTTVEPGFANFDLVYGHMSTTADPNRNAEGWKKFANTLRLRMAMRISAVDPQKAEQEAKSAIADGLIASNGESAYVKFGKTGTTGINPLAFNNGGMRMSTTMQYMLTGLGGEAWPASIVATEHPSIVDPRGTFMFDLSSGIKKGDVFELKGRWTGTYPGLSGVNISTPANTAEANSFIGSKFRVNDNPFAILKYSETCFLLAEASLNGWVAESAESWYNNGITASMSEYGISNVTSYLDDTTPNTFGTTVKFSDLAGANNTQLDKIMTQKWIVLYPENSWEAWAEFRRTNRPRLIPVEYADAAFFRVPASNVSTNPKAFIQRLPYPQSEATTNTENYNAAIASIGGAEFQIQVAVWWDPHK